MLGMPLLAVHLLAMHLPTMHLLAVYLAAVHLAAVHLAAVIGDVEVGVEAEQVLRQMLELTRKVLGPEHPDKLESMNYLASVLSIQGKYAEAEQMDRQTLELSRKVSLATSLMQPYQYSGALLDRQIRLLRLELDWTFSIRCSLVVSSLQQAKYSALSYTWGDPTDRVPI